MASKFKAGRPIGAKDKRRRKRRTIKVILADKRFLSINEAADDAGLSRGTILKNLGEIGFKQVDRRRIIDRTRLHKWLAVDDQVAA